MASFEKKEKYDFLRSEMVNLHLAGRDISDPAVLDVMSKIPRERFLPEKYASEAYADYPVPIGDGQTISQPYIVALMTQCLRLNDQCNVLEIGTGSGYQAAILAKLAKKVYTIERYHQLSESAQTAIASLRINNVEFYVGDGSQGWPDDDMLFDRIIATAAMPNIPDPVIKQLKNNGLMVAPVGGAGFQELMVIEKQGKNLSTRNVCPCRFVKLIGKYGFHESE